MALKGRGKGARYTIRSRPEALLRRLLIQFPFWITLSLLVGAALVALAGVTDPHQAAHNPEEAPGSALSAPERAIVDRYCLGCHNGKIKSGNLALDLIENENVSEHPEQWERAVRKLRARMMPPPGLPRPDERTYDELIRSLESTLDRASAAHP